MKYKEQIPLALQSTIIPYDIRPVTLDDVATLQACLWQHRSFRDIQDFIARVLKFTEQKRGLGIVVTNALIDPHLIVAYGQVTRWLQCAEISDLIVSTDYQSQGIGTAMIQHLTQSVIQTVDCVELGVAESNPRALKLYQALGFRERYKLKLDLGEGHEPVIYLGLDLTPYR